MAGMDSAEELQNWLKEPGFVSWLVRDRFSNFLRFQNTEAISEL